MNKFSHSLFITLLFNVIFILPSLAQSGTGIISGRISDENGQPQVGATIFVEEYTLGTTANAYGNYQLYGVPIGQQIV